MPMRNNPCPAFRELGERHGAIDFGMVPISAYQSRHIMRPMHLNPEEAVRTTCRG
jgi:N-acyl-phosphatidylethanolamine-hydrolysing phospholipase D